MFPADEIDNLSAWFANAVTIDTTLGTTASKRQCQKLTNIGKRAEAALTTVSSFVDNFQTYVNDAWDDVVATGDDQDFVDCITYVMHQGKDRATAMSSLLASCQKTYVHIASMPTTRSTSTTVKRVLQQLEKSISGMASKLNHHDFMLMQLSNAAEEAAGSILDFSPLETSLHPEINGNRDLGAEAVLEFELSLEWAASLVPAEEPSKKGGRGATRSKKSKSRLMPY
ncbi:hypothetical protein HDU97_001461 [Phlyctochytrium planicorne]|nr:hypothetical protein HDU97_001461 [Phlyctochytrium planicorne]